MKIKDISKETIPIWEYFANVYKLFSSSKSFWSVTYLLIPFLLSQLIAIISGERLSESILKLINSDTPEWLKFILELIAGYLKDSGDWAIVGVLLFILVLMVFVKLIEKDK